MTVSSSEKDLGALIKAGTNLTARTVYITGNVDTELAVRTAISLEVLDATDGDIRIVLNSDGGDEDQGYAIFDSIRMCRNKVIIDGYGCVMSIAAAILQAGDVRRLAPNSNFMIHHGFTDAIAEADLTVDQDVVMDLASKLKTRNKKYYQILQMGSNQPFEVIEDFCRDETYMTASEAVCVGFADEVIRPVKHKWSPAKLRRKKK